MVQVATVELVEGKEKVLAVKVTPSLFLGSPDDDAIFCGRWIVWRNTSALLRWHLASEMEVSLNYRPFRDSSNGMPPEYVIFLLWVVRRPVRRVSFHGISE